ncbi:molybdopterin-dependent oxidoreductase [Nocardioides campestrisoli]|uniref:molybdopterin-dependent oxidoreductase n=1 Tax=Nocardioides campestrisoli TaxID=2736757 RepID=UPI00163DD44B|nr:molybdopterin-dependent oxidoreductase [Nocardioides campestrisoli]
MTSSRSWVLAGVVAGTTGLATSYLAAKVLTIRETPLVAAADLVVRLTPGPVAEWAIETLGPADKPVLMVSVVLVLLGSFALAGWAWGLAWWRGVLAWLAVAGAGLLAVLLQRGAGMVETLPLAVGLVTTLVVTAGLGRAGRVPDGADPEKDGDLEGDGAGTRWRGGRRGLLLGLSVAAVVTVASTAIGRIIGNRKRAVQESRRLLRIPGVTDRDAPARARIGLEGVTSWRTPSEEFYRIDTTLAVPTIDPGQWRLRIHGMVDREVVLTYDDLVTMELTEAWVTLNCVSNPVGGGLVGNAWWSGVRTATLLELAGVQDGADAVLQTSEDGWDCSTPLSAMTDERDAMVAVAMNGEPLTIEHGFPARTLVPGLYGYVSACKWVVDWEVTRFDRVEAFWTQRGWAEQGPVKIASRIDVPAAGDSVPAGQVRVGGVAWHQHVGISAVEVALDGGDWQEAEIASPKTDDTWVQWAATVPVPEGEHVLRVRARGKDGAVQTGVRRDVVPDGATGWHTVEFTAAGPDD